MRRVTLGLFFLTSLLGLLEGSFSSELRPGHEATVMSAKAQALLGLDGAPSIRWLRNELQTCTDATLKSREVTRLPGPSREELALCEAKDSLLQATASKTEWVHGIQEPVFYFSEIHRHSQSRELLISLLPELRAAGFDTLALEMLPRGAQPLLDLYAAGRISTPVFSEVFRRYWSQSNNGGWKSYIELIYLARSLDMKLIAINADSTFSAGAQHVFVEADWGRRELVTLDVDPEGSWPGRASRVEYQDAVMAASLAEHLSREPESRIVALVGGLHALKQLDAQGPQRSQSEMLWEGYQIPSYSMISLPLYWPNFWARLVSSLDLHNDWEELNSYLIEVDSEQFLANAYWLYPEQSRPAVQFAER